MLTYDDLARACREGDKRSNEVPLPQFCEELGVDMQGLLDAAEQRAIRVAFMIAGKEIPKSPGKTPVEIPISKEEFINIQSTALDGIAIGLRAAKNAQESAS